MQILYSMLLRMSCCPENLRQLGIQTYLLFQFNCSTIKTNDCHVIKLWKLISLPKKQKQTINVSDWNCLITFSSGLSCKWSWYHSLIIPPLCDSFLNLPFSGSAKWNWQLLWSWHEGWENSSKWCRCCANFNRGNITLFIFSMEIPLKLLLFKLRMFLL